MKGKNKTNTKDMLNRKILQPILELMVSKKPCVINAKTNACSVHGWAGGKLECPHLWARRLLKEAK